MKRFFCKKREKHLKETVILLVDFLIVIFNFGINKGYSRKP